MIKEDAAALYVKIRSLIIISLSAQDTKVIWAELLAVSMGILCRSFLSYLCFVIRLSLIKRYLHLTVGSGWFVFHYFFKGTDDFKIMTKWWHEQNMLSYSHMWLKHAGFVLSWLGFFCSLCYMDYWVNSI